MISHYSTFEPPMLAKIDYLFTRHGENFHRWLLHHLVEREHYVFKGDDYFLMGWKQPEGWVVYFAYCSSGVPLDTLFDLMPYHAEYIGFCRGLRGKKDLKFYRTDRLRKLCARSGKLLAG